MLKPQYSEGFRKQYKKLPRITQKKFLKQLEHLLDDRFHPSLRSKKMSGSQKYEARVDYHYRFTFSIIADEVWLLTVGPHDEGLGKK